MITAKSNRVNRGEFLQALEAVKPGLSPKGRVEHSNSFSFRNGYVEAFNDEIACRMRTKLPKEVKGIVASKSLLAYLAKITDDAIDIRVNDETKEFTILGRGRKADLLTQFEDTFAIDGVERPGKSTWKPLSPRFGDAVAMVAECALKADEANQNNVLTCVHVHPTFVEASDDVQWCRFRVKTPTPAAFLVRKEAVKHLVGLDMTEFAETESWVHFRNPAGLVFSCRRLVLKYPDVAHLLESVNGRKMTLPKELAGAVEAANVFAAEDKDANALTVELEPGVMRLRGVGVSGRAVEKKKCDYAGPKAAFMIQPKMLVEITKREAVCAIEKNDKDAMQLRMKGDRWQYLSELAPPAEVRKAAEAQTRGEGEE